MIWSLMAITGVVAFALPAAALTRKYDIQPGF